jgi:hypothetical protein
VGREDRSFARELDQADDQTFLGSQIDRDGRTRDDAMNRLGILRR